MLDTSAQSIRTSQSRNAISCPSHTARLRLYGDAFTDALAKQGYLNSPLSLGELFWLPQCVALHETGLLDLQAGGEQFTGCDTTLRNWVESKWGTRPCAALLGSIVEGYHEHWDGQGYPYGLKGTAIPLAPRIAAIVGAYAHEIPIENIGDKLRHFHAIDQLHRAVGNRLDPHLVELFASLGTQLMSINQRCARA